LVSGEEFVNIPPPIAIESTLGGASVTAILRRREAVILGIALFTATIDLENADLGAKAFPL
jgi:hypothetical protein